MSSRFSGACLCKRLESSTLGKPPEFCRASGGGGGIIGFRGPEAKAKRASIADRLWRSSRNLTSSFSSSDFPLRATSVPKPSCPCSTKKGSSRLKRKVGVPSASFSIDDDSPNSPSYSCWLAGEGGGDTECRVDEHCPGKVATKLGASVSAINGPFSLSPKRRTSSVVTAVASKEAFSFRPLAWPVSPPLAAATVQARHGRHLRGSSAAIQASSRELRRYYDVEES